MCLKAWPAKTAKSPKKQVGDSLKCEMFTFYLFLSEPAESGSSRACLSHNTTFLMNYYAS